jgi:DNA-binding GntR family transcriptional regulator
VPRGKRGDVAERRKECARPESRKCRVPDGPQKCLTIFSTMVYQLIYQTWTWRGTISNVVTDTDTAECLKQGVSSTLVLREFENAILSGYFRPRERLVERDLLAHFNVSRTVIREVLKTLEGKGLVKTTPYRGAIVVDLDVEEVEEIYFLRAKLEALAAGLVIKHITPKEIRHLKKLCRELEKHLRNRTDQMIEKDNAFHRALFRPSKNRCLNDMIDYLSTKAHMVKFNAWSLPGGVEQSVRAHRAMMEALERQDEEAFEGLVVDHILSSKNSYVAQLKGMKGRGQLRTVRVQTKGRDRDGQLDSGS